MSVKDFVSPGITLIIGAVSIIINYLIFKHNSSISSDQAFRDLFREFNKRFDDLNESLNDIIEGRFDSRHEKKIIQDYLNLCSEEYLWKRKGRIPEEVWGAWEEGILSYLKDPKIRAYFEAEKQYDKSYYGFINYILRLIPTSK